MEISGFGVVLLFIVGGILFLLLTLFIGKLLRPNRPNEQKLISYESGEDPISSAWGSFNFRFYTIAIAFLLFEAELIFLFPWAIVFGDESLNEASNGLWGWFAIWETFIFIGLLAVGLAYIWRNGMLDWLKPKPETTNIDSPVPQKLYQELNKKYS